MPVRNRRAPERLLPEPLIVRNKKRKKNERPKMHCPKAGPPWMETAKSKSAEFLFNHFGRALENEEKGNKHYEYFNRYGRSDLTKATFEKTCFICKDAVFDKLQTETGHEHEFDNKFIFCGVEGCPKVYHTACLEKTRDRYSFILNDTEVSCPHHHCSQCGAEFYTDITLCRLCPYSVCSNCSGIRGLKQALCYGCNEFTHEFDAPEMRMDLHANWKLYTVD